jgi:hypothetical protein
VRRRTPAFRPASTYRPRRWHRRPRMPSPDPARSPSSRSTPMPRPMPRLAPIRRSERQLQPHSVALAVPARERRCGEPGENG